MNNHQNTIFHQLGHFIKTYRSPAGTGFNKIPNSPKSVILPITPIYTKVSFNLPVLRLTLFLTISFILAYSRFVKNSTIIL
ncbi:hypothetical protein SPBRAN_147 [uncultured Candidatus Thioglobus sp.]|nr:hypothetical protein SPBRAN_147 [uncultured Candidatus Thioglobus sp.]